jgi:Ni/Co efflux regulator RcnB
MKQLIAAVCFALAAAPLALAQEKGKDGDRKAPVAEKSKKSDAAKKEPSEKQKAQQARMKDCAGKAGDKKMKGEERKSFMKECMSA